MASVSISLGMELDYLVIGHVTRDLVGDVFTLGGTVSYAAKTAAALGCRVGVITSASEDLDLNPVFDGVSVVRHLAPATTTFDNIYRAEGRRQRLHTVATRLVPGMVPTNWHAAIVHLGPVADECDPSLIDAFPDTFIGVTPQGWMRAWDGSGQVHYARWKGSAPLLARADAVVLSQEDLAEDERLITQYADQARLLVVTQGARGCTVYTGGRSRQFPAGDADEKDPTGAGDIFAAAFFVYLNRSGDPWLAAQFANCVAARSVTRKGLAGVPHREEIVRCKQKKVGQRGKSRWQ